MKKLHLIANAHIDPIWQWTWDEGITAAISTFKSAADLADEFDYIFCHNEAILYEAIEKHAPELFERIKQLIKIGKWQITGGWYLQPDCLMPSGEALLRQISVGRKYFKEKFGIAPSIATNYDSFGHSLGIVQLLKKNGYTGYMICRPRSGDQFEYPARFFKWSSPDGSSVTVTQSASYNSLLGHAAEKIEKAASGEGSGMLGSESSGKANASDDSVDYVLWGVGNHGGGPSRKDLTDIRELKIDGVQLIHSTPEALFNDKIQVGGEVNTSLVTCMPGCYSSMARIKQRYRKVENLFLATEKMLAAAKLLGFKADAEALSDAEKKLLLAQFHDILPGSCIEDAEEDALAILRSAEKTLKDLRTAAFLYLSINGEPAREGEYPIFVFNYMPYEAVETVAAEFSLADQNWSEKTHFMPTVFDENGKEIPSQLTKEGSTLNLDWRKKIIFEAKLKPLGITRFTVKVIPTATEKKEAEPIDPETFFVGASLTKLPFELELYEDTADPWGMSNAELIAMGKNPISFRLMNGREAADFAAVKSDLAPFRKIEDGNIYTAIEAFYTAGKTNAVMQYKLYKKRPIIDLKLTVEFADKNKLVRLRIPIPSNIKNGRSVGDGPFIVEEKPSSEITFQKWLGVKGDGEDIFAVINDGIYSGKIDGGYIYLTLLRGAGYCFHPIYDRELYPQDRYLPRIDCGRYVYNIRIIRGAVSDIAREAEAFNQQPYAINVFPIGGEIQQSPRFNVSGNVVTSAVKISENGGYVMRFFNPSERRIKFTASVGNDACELNANGGEVISITYRDGNFKIHRDEMPV